MHLSPSPAKAPLIDLTVHDADFKPTDNPFISSIRVWYEHENLKTANSDQEDLEQVEPCGHDFLNYLRNVRGEHYESVDAFWYQRKLRPTMRNKIVEEYLEYRANNYSNQN